VWATHCSAGYERVGHLKLLLECYMKHMDRRSYPINVRISFNGKY